MSAHSCSGSHLYTCQDTEQRREGKLFTPPWGRLWEEVKGVSWSQEHGVVCDNGHPEGFYGVAASCSFPHSHFSNLFAIVTQDLEEPIQDLRQVIQQVNVRHRHQNQDLMEEDGERES